MPRDVREPDISPRVRHFSPISNCDNLARPEVFIRNSCCVFSVEGGTKLTVYLDDRGSLFLRNMRTVAQSVEATALQVGKSRVRFPVVLLKKLFYSYDASGRILTLALTQPLTEMTSRNISLWVKAAGE